MLIAGFDTATDMLTVAVADEHGTLAHADRLLPRQHMSRLLPMLREVLDEAGVTLAELDALAVGVGPGSFTGVRIGVATAQGMALAGGKPLIGISTLDVVARGVIEPDGATVISAVLDAKRREIYAGAYSSTVLLPDALQGPLVTTPEEWAEQLATLGTRVCLVGDGLETYGDRMSARLGAQMVIAERSCWYPKASVLIALARERIKLDEECRYHEVLPVYTRLSDAEEALKRPSK